MSIKYKRVDFIQFQPTLCPQLLVNVGADVNATTSKKYAALHHAAEKGHAPIVDFLLKNGAEVQWARIAKNGLEY